MTSQRDEYDLVDKLLVGYAALLSEMTRFYETDFSHPRKQPKVRDVLLLPADLHDEKLLALDLMSVVRWMEMFFICFNF